MYLLPDLKKAGIKPTVFTIASDLDESASTSLRRHAGRGAAEGGRASQSVIPMLPENAFQPYIGRRRSSSTSPQLLLSDYDVQH